MYISLFVIVLFPYFKQFAEHSPRKLLFRLGSLMFGRVIEHTCTQTHSPVITLEYIVIHTPLTPLPELLVVGKFRESDRLVTYARVEFHYRQRCGNTEYLGIRKLHSRKLESLLFDSCGQTGMSVLRINYQTRCGHKIAMPPTFYITESHEIVTIKSYYGLAAGDFT